MYVLFEWYSQGLILIEFKEIIAVYVDIIINYLFISILIGKNSLFVSAIKYCIDQETCHHSLNENDTGLIFVVIISFVCLFHKKD